MRRWHRKTFTGWSCIEQTSHAKIFIARDLLINLSLSSISLFCIWQKLGLVIGYSHFHFTFSCVKVPSLACSEHRSHANYVRSILEFPNFVVTFSIWGEIFYLTSPMRSKYQVLFFEVLKRRDTSKYLAYCKYYTSSHRGHTGQYGYWHKWKQINK